jgi:hypothetical protein
VHVPDCLRGQLGDVLQQISRPSVLADPSSST